MARLANAYGYGNPFGDAVSNIAKLLLSTPGPGRQEADRALAEYRRAQIAKTGAETALLNQQGDAGRRIASIFTQAPGQHALANTQPSFEADDMNMGFQGPELDRVAGIRAPAQDWLRQSHGDLAANAALAGGTMPQNIGNLYRSFIANMPGSSDADVARAVVGAGGMIGENQGVSLEDRDAVAARNAESKLAHALTVQDAAPRTEAQNRGAAFAALSPEEQAVAVGPTHDRVRGGIMHGMQGGLSRDERLAAVGAEPRQVTPRIIHDPESRTGASWAGGHVDGQPAIPPQAATMDAMNPGAAELKSARETVIQARTATDKLASDIEDINAMLASARDPDQIVGILGRAAGTLNSIRAQLEATVRLAGGDTANMSMDLRDYAGTFQRLGIESNELQAALLNLGNSIAMTRSPRPSTRLVQMAIEEVGGNLGDSQALRTTLERIRRQAARHANITESNFREVHGNRLGIEPRAATGAPTAPASPPAGGSQRMRFNPETGRIE